MFLTPTPHHIRFVAAPPEGGCLLYTSDAADE